MESQDAELIRQVLSGDHDAFSRLFARYRDAHFRFAVRMLGNRFDADDALQSAWLRAFRHLHRCEDPRRFASWVYSIVVNECRSAVLMRGRRERWYVDDDSVMDSAASDDFGDDTSLREEIDIALAALEPLHREAFLLKHVEQLSYQDIVRITGASESALKMRVKRACAQLRQLLEGVQHV
jgi:RNA polymerase sigma-70 factor, ECF subfamily